MHEYWLRQDKDKPLFEDLLWSRPEGKRFAGKLLIIGGNAGSFLAVSEAFAAAETAGAGVVRILLPDALQKTVGQAMPAAEFAASTPVSGSFSRQALNEWLIQSEWADSVLLAGDMGRNSETAVLLEGFVRKYQGRLVITKDAADYFLAQAELIATRPRTILVISTTQLQKLATALKFETPILSSMGMMLLAQALHSFTERFSITVVTKELDQIVVAHEGHVSSTKLASNNWQADVAARAAVWDMQNPNRAFEAITTALAA